MPKLGELTVEELINGADREAAYLAERLNKQARERGANPDDIEEVITSATIASVRSHLIVAQGRIREQHQAGPRPTATAPDTNTKPDPARSEHQSAEAMTVLLVALGVPAQTINTGGSCWASSITLTQTVRLELNDFPGEMWSWSLYQHGGDQVMGGHWDSADDNTVATKAKALIDAMGSIVA
ncbi:hypothetical protein [Streptomyces sp. CA-106110]|uniref:hypothetical protein n=1 Tax=Streptomyces sp. CA-106110 TaxID=3240044 RepID=UPI003D9410DF